MEIFPDDLQKRSWAFRGGTVLHKLYFQPHVRYSEDIDLVQINSEPINPILQQIRERLAFLGTKRVVKQHIHNNTVVYRSDMSIQPIINLRLKIEINTHKHFMVLGLKEIHYKIENGWFFGECNLTVYELEELLGRKMRALFQRHKGRDLLICIGQWLIRMLMLKNNPWLKTCMEYFADKSPTQKQFLANMEEKLLDREFMEDIHAILKPGVEHNNESDWLSVKNLIEKV